MPRPSPLSRWGARPSRRQHVDKLEDHELRPQFLEELQVLLSTVYKNARVKRLYNQNLNGSSACSQHHSPAP